MSSKPKIVLFDIDKTILDSPLVYRELAWNKLANLRNVSIDEINSLENAYKQTIEKYTDYDPLEFFRTFIAEEEIEEIAQKTIYNPHFHQQGLFKDVTPVLKQLSESFTLGIFSEGVHHFQLSKLEINDLLQFFDPELLFILRRKTSPESLASIPSDAIIIDDNTDVIDELVDTKKFHPIWINRYKKKPPKSNTPHIKNFHSISTIVES